MKIEIASMQESNQHIQIWNNYSRINLQRPPIMEVNSNSMKKHLEIKIGRRETG